MTSVDFQLSYLTIVLIGKDGAGKTAFLNTLQSYERPVSESGNPVLSDRKECQITKVKIGNQSVDVVDTPDLDKEEAEKVAEDIKRFVSDELGPFVFLIVMEPGRFTILEEYMMEVFWKTFDDYAAQFTFVLFYGDKVESKNMIKSKKVRDLFSKCNKEQFFIDNINPDMSEVSMLLTKICNIINKKEKKGYTCEDAEEDKWSQIKKLCLNVSAVVGAGVGAVATYIFGGAAEIPGGFSAGAIVGRVVAFAVVVATRRIKAKK